MEKQLIVNVAPGETRVALLEDGKLAELFVERGEEENLSGGIYKGRVQRVLPGMQAAFVDIGLKQAAFLYVDDVMPDPATIADDDGERTRNPRIEDLLKDGQVVMVQIAKAPVGTKGARVTTQISLPGRFLVLMPTVDHVGVSRRIEGDGERHRLKTLLEAQRTTDHGYIFRTAAEGVDGEAIGREMEMLTRLWSGIQNRFETQKAPCCIHRDLSVTFRAVRDLLTHDDARTLVIDSKEACSAVRQFLARHMPDMDISVAYYGEPEPIFDAYHIEGEIRRVLRKKVWLKSGGYIIIEQTEALVAIDVNTGRYVGKENFEETILKTNLEACREIAYQIRVRNLCGILIIDFIDMARSANQDRVYTELKDALKKDKTKTHVLPMSEMGLVQMTRKRVRKSLSRILSAPCACCDGRGYTAAPETVCHQIYRELLRQAQDMEGESFSVYCHPHVADLLSGAEKELMASVGLRIKKPVHICPEPYPHAERFDIVENLIPVTDGENRESS